MSAKTLLLCGIALLQAQSVLAMPVADNVPTVKLDRRENVTVDPVEPVPIVTEIDVMTEEELQELIEEYGGEPDDNSNVKARQSASQVISGALLTFSEGDGGAGGDGCEPFELNGPFTSFHPLMGSGNVRGLTATSLTGNTTFIGNDDDVTDPGLLEFANNERVTKFSIGRTAGTAGVRSFRLETDAGQTYEALSGNVAADPTLAVYEDLDVGSGIIARFTGSYCGTIFSTFGVDFLDELDSISITNIDYDGFTNNIMPTGRGTQLSVGSQILDNRNSSEKQTITLTTTDTITRQTTIITQTRYQVGASVAVKASAKVPFISETEITTEANWQLEELSADQEMDNAVTTRAGTFALVCPAGKFCTAKAFFTQFKMDVNMNATFTATVKSGETFDWVQSGTYKGADSLSMQFNVTEVDNVN